MAELFPRINTGKKTTGDDFLRSFQGGTVIAKSLERECTLPTVVLVHQPMFVSRSSSRWGRVWASSTFFQYSSC